MSAAVAKRPRNRQLSDSHARLRLRPRERLLCQPGWGFLSGVAAREDRHRLKQLAGLLPQTLGGG
jgi:hypothetical protein